MTMTSIYYDVFHCEFKLILLIIKLIIPSLFYVIFLYVIFPYMKV